MCRELILEFGARSIYRVKHRKSSSLPSNNFWMILVEEFSFFFFPIPWGRFAQHLFPLIGAFVKEDDNFQKY